MADLQDTSTVPDVPLPEGWGWDWDDDGYWCATKGPVCVYLASFPPDETVTTMIKGGHSVARAGGRSVGAPVRIAVAVMQANGLPWKPSTDPMRCWWEKWNPESPK